MRTALADDFTDWVDAIIDAPTYDDVSREVGQAVLPLTRLGDGPYFAEVVWRLTSAARARTLELDDRADVRVAALLGVAR